MPKIMSPFFATTVFAVILAGCLWQQLYKERQLAGELRERVVQLELGQTRHPVAADQRARPAQDSAASDCSMPAGGTETGPIMQAGSSATMTMPDWRYLLKDKEYRKARLALLRTSIPRAYPDLVTELALTPGQADGLFDLLARQQLDSKIAYGGGYDGETSSMERATELYEATRKDHAEIEKYLGPEKYRQFREYGQTAGSRAQAEEFRALLATTTSPLTEEQRRPLVADLVAEQKRLIEDARLRGRTPGYPSAGLDPDQESLKSREESSRRVLDRAQSYLYPQQLAALRESMEQRLNLNRVAVLAQRARRGAAEK